MEKIGESFKALTDEQLLAEVKALVARERDATIVLVASLAEVAARKLYRPLGYSSLYKYCTEELLLSPSAAYSRIKAARTVRAFPVAINHLADGSVTLSTLNVLGPHLTVDNHEELLQAARYQTKETVERQMAARTPGAPDMVSIHVRVTVETRDKLRRAQDLLRHVIPDGNTAEVIDRALTLLVADLEKKRLAKVKRPRVPPKVSPDNTRYIPNWMRRALFNRDGGQCKFVGTSGRCSETGGLEVHHLKPFAKGGRKTLANLELRCAAHNKYQAERDFGVRYKNSS